MSAISALFLAVRLSATLCPPFEDESQGTPHAGLASFRVESQFRPNVNLLTWQSANAVQQLQLDAQFQTLIVRVLSKASTIIHAPPADEPFP